MKASNLQLRVSALWRTGNLNRIDARFYLTQIPTDEPSWSDPLNLSAVKRSSRCCLMTKFRFRICLHQLSDRTTAWIERLASAAVHLFLSCLALQTVSGATRDTPDLLRSRPHSSFHDATIEAVRVLTRLPDRMVSHATQTHSSTQEPKLERSTKQYVIFQAVTETISQTSDETKQGDIATTQQQKDTETQTLSEQEIQQIKQAIESLGAKQFADRERAATKLLNAGKLAIPEMQRAIEQSTDAETRLRIEQVVKQLADGDLQARIKAFLAGQEVQFKGWPVVQRFLGNSITIRELFVEIMEEHPYVGESMEGTTRERAIALESTLAAVQPKLNTIRDEPRRADLFSLLLVALDPEVPLPALHEQIILRLCQRSLVTEIRKDASLSGPFAALMNRWILRAGTTNREDILLTGMEMNLSSTLILAVSTLEENGSADTIATAFQVITRFGGRQHIPLIENFFTKEEVVGAPALRDDPSLPQLGDIAVATVAILLGQPLEEIGMEKIALHPTRGFLLPSRLFENDPSEQRKASRSKVREWMTQEVVPSFSPN